MALKFRITEQNADIISRQIEATLNKYKEAYLTGCGNIYNTVKGAMDKKIFTNPEQEEATYVLSFKIGDKIPKTAEQFKNAFLKSRDAEYMEENAVVDSGNKISMPKIEIKKESKKEEKI